MTRIIKSKSKKGRKKNALTQLRKAYEELDRTARTLIRTDYLLHRANERFDQQISQLHALHRIGTSINSTFDLELILSEISESMTKDLESEIPLKMSSKRNFGIQIFGHGFRNYA